jgi:signal transduction histidine kinase
MRLLIFELRPPVLEQEGLVAALETRLEAVEERSGLEAELFVHGEGRLPADIEEGLYRIAQEALNNVLRHAHARRVTVHLCQGGESVKLEVTDDGTGFDPASARARGGLGLAGMEERAVRLRGRLTLDSKPGAGTTIRVEV